MLRTTRCYSTLGLLKDVKVTLSFLHVKWSQSVASEFLLIFSSEVFSLWSIEHTLHTCQKQIWWWAAAPASPGHGWCMSPWQPVAGRRGGRGSVIRWRSASAPPPLCASAWFHRAAPRCRNVTWPRPEQPYLRGGREDLHLLSVANSTHYYSLKRLVSPSKMGMVAKNEQRSVYTTLSGELSTTGGSKGRRAWPPHTRRGKRIAEAAIARDTFTFLQHSCWHPSEQEDKD